MISAYPMDGNTIRGNSGRLVLTCDKYLGYMTEFSKQPCHAMDVRGKPSGIGDSLDGYSGVTKAIRTTYRVPLDYALF